MAPADDSSSSARAMAEAFTTRTGIEVRLVTDTEETKSTGLLNRLIAEGNRPQADVFWSGDGTAPWPRRSGEAEIRRSGRLKDAGR